MAKKAGRPEGAKTNKYDIVDDVKTACNRCGSTDRTEYGVVIRYPQSYTHISPITGQPFNCVEFRPTECKKCGQRRKDRRLRLLESEDD
jgi:hypothetical protein